MTFSGIFGPPNIDKLIVSGDMKGLIKALKYQNSSNIRQNAAKALGEIGDNQAVEPLVSTLTENDNILRKNAIIALGRIKDIRAVEPLIGMFSDKNKEIRLSIISALGAIGGSQATNLLNSALFDNDREIRRGAFYALKKNGPISIDQLKLALTDKNPEIRRDAIIFIREGNVDAALPFLINALRNEDKSVREEATRTFTYSKFYENVDDTAIEQLITNLKDENPQIRSLSAEALGKIRSARALEPLIAAVDEGNFYLAHLSALESIGDPRAIEPLVDFLTSNKGFSFTALTCISEVLDSLGWKPLTNTEKAWYWTAKHEWEKCVDLGSFAVDPLISFILKDEGDVVQQDITGFKDLRLPATRALGDIGDVRAIDPLIIALKNGTQSSLYTKDTWYKSAGKGLVGCVIKALEKFGPLSVDPLINAFNSDDRYMRIGAVEALVKIADERAVDTLIAALKDSEFEVRLNAIKALGNIKTKRAVEPLFESLNEDYIYLRLEAIKALGKIGDPRAIPTLILHLQEANSKRTEFVGEGAEEALIKIGSVAVIPLVEALKNSDYSDQTKRLIIKALGEIGDVRAINPLIDALNYEKNYEVRITIIESLGKIRDPRAIDPLILALKNDLERSYVVKALGNIGDVRAVEPLINALNDDNKYIRSYAIEALGEIKDFRAVDPLIEALTDKEKMVREDAVQALGNIGDVRAVEPLINTLNDNERNVRLYSIVALGKIGDVRAKEPLFNIAKKGDEGERGYSIEALKNLGLEWEYIVRNLN